MNFPILGGKFKGDKEEQRKKEFVEAYDRHIEEIYRFILFKVGDKETAEDLSSSVFLKAWNHVQASGRFDHKTARALVYKIARNAVIDHYRLKAKEAPATIEEAENIADEKIDLEESAAVSSDIKLVSEKLKYLKDEYREIIILRFIEEMSITEIAEILNKPKGGIRVLIYRALKALKDLIEEKTND